MRERKRKRERQREREGGEREGLRDAQMKEKGKAKSK